MPKSAWRANGLAIVGLVSACAPSSAPQSAASAGAAKPAVAKPAEPGAANPTPAPSAFDPSDPADVFADRFLKELKAGDFAKARTSFDATLKQALPEQKLSAVWSAQTAQLGQVKSWGVEKRAEVPSTDVRVMRLAFERGELFAIIAINRETKELAGLYFEPVPVPFVSAPYVSANVFRNEEVSVGEAPFVLQGTLALPRGAGPFPAVVLVHGSGPHDRDESIGPNKPFADIAEGLASRGVAVLRYDKRTFAHVSEVHRDISIDEEVVVDAVAALRLLQVRPEVDAAHIVVVGHSLGAQLAPEIAAQFQGASGVVLLAPPGRPPWEAVLAQLKYLEAPASQLAEVEVQAKSFRAGKFEGELLGAPASYWRDWASRDGVAAAKKLAKPLLILHGDRDYQVTDEDIAVWKRGLAGTRDVEFVTLPGDNHLFIPGAGKPGPAEYASTGHVDVAVIERIATFARSAPKP